MFSIYIIFDFYYVQALVKMLFQCYELIDFFFLSFSILINFVLLQNSGKKGNSV